MGNRAAASHRDDVSMTDFGEPVARMRGEPLQRLIGESLYLFTSLRWPC